MLWNELHYRRDQPPVDIKDFMSSLFFTAAAEDDGFKLRRRRN